jgi:hypothetical protein
MMSGGSQRLQLEPGAYWVYVSYSNDGFGLRLMQAAEVLRDQESVVNVDLDDKWKKRPARLPEEG